MIHDEYQQNQNEDQAYSGVHPKVTKCVAYIDSLVGFAKVTLKRFLQNCIRMMDDQKNPLKSKFSTVELFYIWYFLSLVSSQKYPPGLEL